MTLKKSQHFSNLPDNLLTQTQNTFSKNYYQKIVTYDLILKQNFTNIMELPRIEKIILNTTSKNYVNDKKNILFTLAALEFISGQKAQLTYARKSIANFKIRQHQILGCKVVLRENLMYTFLDKLSRIILPRIRDDVNKKKNLHVTNLFTFQKHCKKSNKFITYSFGVKNLMIFPELENHFELVENLKGMNLCFVLKNSLNKSSVNETRKNAEFFLILSGFQIPVY